MTTTKPALADIRSLLKEYDAYLVHFSRLGKMEKLMRLTEGLEGQAQIEAINNNLDHFYPQDLRYAIAHPRLPLCCSTVRPGDRVSVNSMGAIGLLLDLPTEQSLKAVFAGDDGFLGEDFEVRDRDITLDECRATIKDRVKDCHNEWLVADYQVLGVLCLPPVGYFDPFAQDAVFTTMEAIQREFSSWPVYGLLESGLQRAQLGAQTMIPVLHSQVYT